MDKEFSELEDELAKLDPAEPKAELCDKVFAIFDAESDAEAVPAPAPNNVITWFRPIAAAAAVAIVFFGAIFALNRPSGGPEGPGTVTDNKPEKSRTFVPVNAGNTFEDARDMGVIINHRGEPVRRVRYQFHDTYQWQRLSDGSQIELKVPHEGYIDLPVRTD